MTSDDDGGAPSSWICIDSTPDRSAAVRVEALLRERGVAVRIASGGTAGDEIEVQVPAEQLERAINELAELDAIDGDERRGQEGVGRR